MIIFFDELNASLRNVFKFKLFITFFLFSLAARNVDINESHQVNRCQNMHVFYFKAHVLFLFLFLF